MRSNRVLLEDILERTDRILKNSKGLTREQFEADPNVFEATLRHIEIIGEAVKNLPADVKDAYPNVPWRQIGRTRDILAHVYFAVSEERIWNIVSTEIPSLKVAIEQMIGDLDTSSGQP